MAMEERVLGTLRPVGGGDSIPLKKAELTIGRRPSNDIRLDFENVSGKHCTFRFIKGVWHVKDLGSTNGTTLNGQRFHSEHTVLPDDEVGIATHFFRIDYEPSAPDSVINSDRLIDYGADLTDKGQRKSLLELAGLSADGTAKPSAPTHTAPRPGKATHAAPTAEDFDDSIPETFKPAAAKADVPELSDDEFLKYFDPDK